MNPSAATRPESAGDLPGIRAVVQAAFGQPNEADLVDALRRADALILSAVAVIDDRIVAHLAFSPVTIQSPAAATPALALAPVGVDPAHQNQGIGSALIRWGLAESARMGHGIVIVLGEPVFYGRFGFKPASLYGIECPFPAPPEAFMALELAPGAAARCRGTVRYRPEFGLV